MIDNTQLWPLLTSYTLLFLTPIDYPDSYRDYQDYRNEYFGAKNYQSYYPILCFSVD